MISLSDLRLRAVLIADVFIAISSDSSRNYFSFFMAFKNVSFWVLGFGLLLLRTSLPLCLEVNCCVDPLEVAQQPPESFLIKVFHHSVTIFDNNDATEVLYFCFSQVMLFRPFMVCIHF